MTNSNGRILLEGAGLVGNLSFSGEGWAGNEATLSAPGGQVELRGQDVMLGGVDLGNLNSTSQPVPGPASRIDVGGSPAGGTVTIAASNNVTMDASATINASGTSVGGAVDITAGNLLALYGSISANGGSQGGTITTSTTGGFDLRGLRVSASGASAGTWSLLAPSIDIVSGGDYGNVDYTGGTAATAQPLQDQEINWSLSSGTNVSLSATAGDIDIAPGTFIFADDAGVPLQLRFSATGNVAGNDFSIQSNSAPLSVGMELSLIHI